MATPDPTATPAQRAARRAEGLDVLDTIANALAHYDITEADWERVREAVADRAEGPEVERLAKALAGYEDDLDDPTLYQPMADGTLLWLAAGHARAIMAEYERLASRPSDERVGEETG